MSLFLLYLSRTSLKYVSTDADWYILTNVVLGNTCLKLNTLSFGKPYLSKSSNYNGLIVSNLITSFLLYYYSTISLVKVYT